MPIPDIAEDKRIIEHMPYNHSLLFQLNSAIQNITLGGSGFEQIQCLRSFLKPAYRSEIDGKLANIDIKYEKNAKYLIDKFNKSGLNSYRYTYLTKLKILRRTYTRHVISELVSLFDKYNVLEEKEREGLKSGLI